MTFYCLPRLPVRLDKPNDSRDEWKNKATERAAKLREFRKTQNRHLEKIAELKRQNHPLEMLVEKKLQCAMSQP